MGAEKVSRIDTILDKAAVACALGGGAIILLQAVWMTWGVFTRYALNSPDRMVTEATALLLFPVAFSGLAFALRRDANPKVTMLLDILPARIRHWIEVWNLVIIAVIGVWFMYVAFSATLRTFDSGVASEILLWPRFYFWIPVMFSMVIFVCCVMQRLVQKVSKGNSSTYTKQGD